MNYKAQGKMRQFSKTVMVNQNTKEESRFMVHLAKQSGRCFIKCKGCHAIKFFEYSGSYEKITENEIAPFKKEHEKC